VDLEGLANGTLEEVPTIGQSAISKSVNRKTPTHGLTTHDITTHDQALLPKITTQTSQN
jgi:hypothetical protein